MYLRSPAQTPPKSRYKGVHMNNICNKDIMCLYDMQINQPMQAIKGNMNNNNFFNFDQYNKVKNGFKLPLGNQTGGIKLQNYYVVINPQKILILKVLLKNMCLSCGYFALSRKNKQHSMFLNSAMNAYASLNKREFYNFYINSHHKPIEKESFKQYMDDLFKKVLQNCNHNVNTSDIQSDNEYYGQYQCDQCKAVQQYELVSSQEVLKRRNYNKYVFSQSIQCQQQYHVYINGEFIFPWYLKSLLERCSKQYIRKYFQIENIFIEQIFIPSLFVMNQSMSNGSYDIRETINQIKDLCFLSTINTYDIATNPLLFLQSDCQISNVQQCLIDDSKFQDIFGQLVQYNQDWFLYICKLYYKSVIQSKYSILCDNKFFLQFEQMVQNNLIIQDILINNAIYINAICSNLVGKLQSTFLHYREAVMVIQKNISSYNYDMCYPQARNALYKSDSDYFIEQPNFNDSEAYMTNFEGPVVLSSVVQYGYVQISVKNATKLAIYDYLRNYSQDIGEALIINGPCQYPGILQINDVQLSQFNTQQRKNMYRQLLYEQNGHKILRHPVSGDLVLLRLQSGKSCLLRLQVLDIDIRIQISPFQFPDTAFTSGTVIMIPEWSSRVELSRFQHQQYLNYSIYGKISIKNQIISLQIAKKLKLSLFNIMRCNQIMLNQQCSSQIYQKSIQNQRKIKGKSNKVEIIDCHEYESQLTEDLQPAILYPYSAYTTQQFLEICLKILLQVYFGEKGAKFILNNKIISQTESGQDLQEYLVLDQNSSVQVEKQESSLFNGEILIMQGDISRKLYFFCCQIERMLELETTLHDPTQINQVQSFRSLFFQILQCISYEISVNKSVGFSFPETYGNGIAISHPIAFYKAKEALNHKSIMEHTISTQLLSIHAKYDNLLRDYVIQYDGSVRNTKTGQLITCQADHLQNNCVTEQDMKWVNFLLKQNKVAKHKSRSFLTFIEQLIEQCNDLVDDYSQEQYSQLVSGITQLLNNIQHITINYPQINLIQLHLTSLRHIEIINRQNSQDKKLQIQEIIRRSSLSNQSLVEKRIKNTVDLMKVQLISLSQESLQSLVSAYKDSNNNYIYTDLSIGSSKDSRAKECLAIFQKYQLLPQNGYIKRMFNEALHSLNDGLIYRINQIFLQLQSDICQYCTHEFQNRRISVQVEVYDKEEQLQQFIESYQSKNNFLEEVKVIKVKQISKRDEQQRQTYMSILQQNAQYNSAYQIHIEIKPAYIPTTQELFLFSNKFVIQLQRVLIDTHGLCVNDQADNPINASSQSAIQQPLNIQYVNGNNKISQINMSQYQQSDVSPVILTNFIREQHGVQINVDAYVPIFISDIELALTNIDHQKIDRHETSVNSINDDTYERNLHIVRKQLKNLLMIVNSASLEVADALQFFGIETAREVLLNQLHEVIMTTDTRIQLYFNDSQQQSNNRINTSNIDDIRNNDDQQLLNASSCTDNYVLDSNQKRQIMKILNILLDSMTVTGQFIFNSHQNTENQKENLAAYLNSKDFNNLFCSDGYIFQLFQDLNYKQPLNSLEAGKLQQCFKQYFPKE